jgi:hypothetical protein
MNNRLIKRNKVFHKRGANREKYFKLKRIDVYYQGFIDRSAYRRRGSVL